MQRRIVRHVVDLVVNAHPTIFGFGMNRHIPKSHNGSGDTGIYLWFTEGVTVVIQKIVDAKAHGSQGQQA